MTCRTRSRRSSAHVQCGEADQPARGQALRRGVPAAAARRRPFARRAPRRLAVPSRHSPAAEIRAGKRTEPRSCRPSRRSRPSSARNHRRRDPDPAYWVPHRVPGPGCQGRARAQRGMPVLLLGNAALGTSRAGQLPARRNQAGAGRSNNHRATAVGGWAVTSSAAIPRWPSARIVRAARSQGPRYRRKRRRGTVPGLEQYHEST